MSTDRKFIHSVLLRPSIRLEWGVFLLRQDWGLALLWGIGFCRAVSMWNMEAGARALVEGEIKDRGRAREREGGRGGVLDKGGESDRVRKT